MRIVDCIAAKRDGKTLDIQDIQKICRDYHKGDIPDYQMSALLMAIFFNGLEQEELLAFTHAMTQSGKTISIPTDNFVLDKHSTGGVGDKVSIALAPILAALDFSLVKLSGRGLGHTGGTVDKFESLSGFNFDLVGSNLHNMLEKCKFALLSYSDDIVPLDKKLYTLRDVTATVQSMPLIASSIMSKKLAVESDGIILDVKVGSGAFMQDLEQAKELAQLMKKIGVNAGRTIDCVLSDMDQPLGYAVGNALELQEAVSVLRGSQEVPDLRQLLDVLVGVALVQRKDISDYRLAKDIVEKTIVSGKAFEFLEKFVTLGGVDKNLLSNEKYLGKTKIDEVVSNVGSRQVKSMDAKKIGQAAMVLGAGRSTKEDGIDYEVGIILNKKRSDTVEKGEVLATLHYTDKTKDENLQAAKNLILESYLFSSDTETVKQTPVLLGCI